ncbi:hypothetical protein [Helicobacter sp. T3_23-1059]
MSLKNGETNCIINKISTQNYYTIFARFCYNVALSLPIVKSYLIQIKYANKNS